MMPSLLRLQVIRIVLFQSIFCSFFAQAESTIDYLILRQNDSFILHHQINARDGETFYFVHRSSLTNLAFLIFGINQLHPQIENQISALGVEIQKSRIENRLVHTTEIFGPNFSKRNLKVLGYLLATSDGGHILIKKINFKTVGVSLERTPKRIQGRGPTVAAALEAFVREIDSPNARTHDLAQIVQLSESVVRTISSFSVNVQKRSGSSHYAQNSTELAIGNRQLYYKLESGDSPALKQARLHSIAAMNHFHAKQAAEAMGLFQLVELHEKLRLLHEKLGLDNVPFAVPAVILPDRY